MLKHKLGTTLTISTVGKLHKPMVGIIAKSKTLELDLSKVTAADSAGIAFLLDLKSIAKNKDCKLNFTSVPDIIARFCSLYEVSL